MSYYDQAAAYAAANPYGGYGYAPMVPRGWGWNGTDIVGVTGDPQADATNPPTTTPPQTTTDKLKAFGQKETFGVKNQNIALVAVGAALLYGSYEAGWLGGHPSASAASSSARDRRRHHRRYY
jgi:hypothetical protein